MKANELMIGDWVQCSSYMGNKVPCKVVGISTDITVEFKNCARKYEALDFAQPIPLTAEILKKNGFDYNDSLAEWATDSFCVEFGHAAFEEEPDHFFVWVSNCEVALNYVHELQHALKLCGIDKNIEL